MKIVCIGSSIVNGFPHKRSQSWPSVLASLSGQTVINKGVNGSTSHDMKTRFYNDVLSHKPDVVFIMAGTNDFMQGINSPEGVLANLSNMVSDAREHGVRPILITSLPIVPDMAKKKWAVGADFNYESVRDDLEILHDLILNYAHDQSIEVADFYGLVADLIRRNGGENCFIDGIHPSANLHSILAASLVALLS